MRGIIRLLKTIRTFFIRLIPLLNEQRRMLIEINRGRPNPILKRRISISGLFSPLRWIQLFLGRTYGTLFNASPLGYELYMQNYIHLNNRQYGVYLKYGRPFKNIGLGFSMNDVLNFNNFKADVLAETWQQDLFGAGASLEFSGKLKLSKHFGLNFNLGYKSEGYVLGKQLNAGVNIGSGISFFR